MTMPVPMPLTRFCDGARANSSSTLTPPARAVRSLWMLTTASRTRLTTSATGDWRTFQLRASGLGASAFGASTFGASGLGGGSLPREGSGRSARARGARRAAARAAASRERCALMRPLALAKVLSAPGAGAGVLSRGPTGAVVSKIPIGRRRPPPGPAGAGLAGLTAGGGTGARGRRAVPGGEDDTVVSRAQTLPVVAPARRTIRTERGGVTAAGGSDEQVAEGAAGGD